MITLLELKCGDPVLVNLNNVDFMDITNKENTRIHFSNASIDSIYPTIEVKESLTEIYKRIKS